MSGERYSRALERDVLGAILNAASIDEHAGRRTMERAMRAGLAADDFYYTSLGALYALLVELQRQRKPLDPLSVAIELEAEVHRRLEGLAAYADLDIDRVRGHLTELAHEVTNFSTIAHKAAVVRALAQARAEQRGDLAA